MSGIYCILCLGNGKFYIGSAVDFKRRFSSHRWQLRQGNHFNQKLQKAFVKYGEENFIFSILEIIEDRDDLLKIEQRAITQLRAVSRGFNLAASVAHTTLGLKRSLECRQRHSRTVTGSGNHFFGKRHSAAAKLRQSLVKRGKPSYVRTPELNSKMSAAMKGRIITSQARAKISAAIKQRNAEKGFVPYSAEQVRENARLRARLRRLRFPEETSAYQRQWQRQKRAKSTVP